MPPRRRVGRRGLDVAVEQRAERHRAQAHARALQEEPAIDLLCELEERSWLTSDRRLFGTAHSSVIVSSRLRMTLAVAV